MNFFAHKTAIVESTRIGNGTKIWAFSHVSSGAQIGENCIIGEGVHIGNDVVIGNGCKIQNHALLYKGVTIEDDVFIGPSVITTNDAFPRATGDWKDRFRPTLFKKGCSIAANSTIICGVTIGENALVGAGSTVLKDIKAGFIAYGNPARHVRRVEG